ncbi:hypothetical protein GCM10011367_15720 [Marinicauda pacifica]|jgi:uncharacterized membrane protein YtjA (UPF0391 family)|uniref:UPF0391 membrane protein E5162_07930 n=1 Tax=Marinicauda pacifica TaxID=1133559 RepID=A0A4S2HAN3_9PROT|nr:MULTISPECIES: DUF1328 domain-containing protein [Marinicauda]TGY92987.1 DUF1328 domain-containing protein [Marinicauda pacifica]GGE41903.1 hypothetical protein GCM10011367_15720 [Marinicauda pacifica]
MFGLALLFFVVALIAGAFGFFGLAGMAAVIAQWVFFIALALAVVSAIFQALRGDPPV